MPGVVFGRLCLGMLFVIGCGTPRWSPVPPIQEVAPSFEAITLPRELGDFTFELRVQEPAVALEPIQIGGILEYLGPDQTVLTYIAGGLAPVSWELRQLDGSLVITSPNPGSCGSRTFERGREYWLPYLKGAAYDPRGPEAEFYRQFLSTPDLRLPEGEWEVAAKLELALGECVGERIESTFTLPLSVAPR
jgi:hypothetical protein